ncbi:hypothetical protein GMORB2_6845 [Geosmithia morbida]|uniref:Uncharacterized protein n=1 Tax=Geosmithia morbida TaxID=1094350 RepID=A0A9P4YUE5_9HYPO|nr:uncharacterized protein GMORB2_6845 [Geosmithia morbida]KAF4123293.1 hypothetical protein GMORB2_6845 [Geosmithia morbida]
MSATRSTLEELIAMDMELIPWRESLGDTRRFWSEMAPHLSAAAVAAMEGEYHVCHDMWVACTRTLLNQVILNLADKYPRSAAQLLVSLVTSEERTRRQALVKEMAREVPVSTPSYWRHPLLKEEIYELVEERGGAGAGAAGLPIFLNQIVVAF